MTLKNKNTLEDFWRRVSKDSSGCWLWTGLISPSGYARFNWQNKGHRAHKFAYEYFVGHVPDNLHLDHLCRVRHCVNPDHLEPVTCRENHIRGISPQVARERLLARTHCKNGHEFSPDNTYTTSGVRICKACSLIRTKKYRERLKCS